MKAIEFRTRLSNNQIVIPPKIQSQLKDSSNKEIRVMILIEDPDIYEEQIFNKADRELSLKDIRNQIQFMTIT